MNAQLNIAKEVANKPNAVDKDYVKKAYHAAKLTKQIAENIKTIAPQDDNIQVVIDAEYFAKMAKRRTTRNQNAENKFVKNNNPHQNYK